jgi:UDP-N-acetylglucosamine 2-epimerase (non-hydrolysing)
VTEESGVVNLQQEGVEASRIFLVGNVMIDTLDSLLPTIRERHKAAELGLSPGGYGVVTLHRPSNVDDAAMLARWVGALELMARRLPLVFPAHPRTAARLAADGLADRLAAAGVQVIEPQPYVEFISLVADARVVLTDSGGIQEETTVLGTPCLTLRESTERPVTVALGTNRLVGTNPEDALRALDDTLAVAPHKPAPPPLWDGHAAERIVELLSGLEWQAYQGDPSASASASASAAAAAAASLPSGR